MKLSLQKMTKNANEEKNLSNNNSLKSGSQALKIVHKMNVVLKNEKRSKNSDQRTTSKSFYFDYFFFIAFT